MDKRIVKFLAVRGVKVIEEDITAKINVWRSWYIGKVDQFHTTKIYTGKKHVTVHRRTLDMASRVCQRWADLLLNEKVEINIEDVHTAEVAHRLLEEVNFRIRGNNLIEAAFAIGGGYMVQQWDGKKTTQKYILQDLAYPITFDSGRVTEIAFCSKKTIDQKEYLYLETHLLDRATGNYVIDNFLFDQSGKELTEVSDEFYAKLGIVPKWETKSKEPLFQLIRPNVANKENFNSPYGTSIFSGAIDVLKTIDIIYDSYGSEFELGRKRIFVTEDVTAIQMTSDGQVVQAFDPNDRVFYRLASEEPAEKPIDEYNPDLRTAAHNDGLQTNLNVLSEKVGLGARGFRWENGSVSTATQVISENSDMFRSLKKHEELLRSAIIGMVRGLLYVEKTFNHDKSIRTDVEITVNFDDSIIEDTAEIKRQALLEYNAGLIDDVAYYMDVYKLTEEQAIQYRDGIAKRKAPVPTEPTPEDDLL